MIEVVRCGGCGAAVPDEPGPVHEYVPSAPGCWAAFGHLQADTAARFPDAPTRRLLVDAYMAQHPGDGSDRRGRQSVCVHLVGLCAALEQRADADRVGALTQRLLETRSDFPVLARDGWPGALTVLDVIGAPDAATHERRVRDWAVAVWDAWSERHDEIRSALHSL